MTIEQLYVVDTNALILSKHRKLSQTARTLFAAAERRETLIVISSVVLAELYHATKKYGLFGDFGAVCSTTLDALMDQLGIRRAIHV